MNKLKQVCLFLKLYQSHPTFTSNSCFARKSARLLPVRLYSSPNHSGLPNNSVRSSQECSSPESAPETVGNGPVQKPNNDLDVNLITGGDPALEKKFKIILLEVDILRQEGDQVPSSLNVTQWKDLLALGSRSSRKKLLTFLFKREMMRENDKKKKEEKQKKRNEELAVKKNEITGDGHLEYGVGKNTFFLRIRESTMNNFYNWKLIQAMMFSQKIVVDCSYDEHMTSREAVNCAKQLMFLFADNRMHVNPFNLYFCNVREGSRAIQEFDKGVVTAREPHFPLNISEKSYLDLFPKDKLVYLTPHCREQLHKFDHEAVYIIGAMVDKVNNKPLSLAKAKQEGLKMAKLPLDQYLLWGSGSGKSLTLNQMINVMLDIRHTGDWKTALRHVPRRKLMDYTVKKYESMQRDRIAYKLYE